MSKPRHLYKNITLDVNLKNGAEKDIFKMFCGWTVMKNRDTFDSGYGTIAYESGYSKEHVPDVMHSLLGKGYLTILREGKGRQCAQYRLNIPNYYILPEKQELDEATKIKLAKRTLIKAGVLPEALDLVVAEGMADKAIKTAKRNTSLKNVIDSEKKQKSLKALLEKA